MWETRHDNKPTPYGRPEPIKNTTIPPRPTSVKPIATQTVNVYDIRTLSIADLDAEDNMTFLMNDGTFKSFQVTFVDMKGECFIDEDDYELSFKHIKGYVK